MRETYRERPQQPGREYMQKVAERTPPKQQMFARNGAEKETRTIRQSAGAIFHASDANPRCPTYTVPLGYQY